MANETLFSNDITVAAYIDAGIMEVLRTTNVMLGVAYPMKPDGGSNAKKLRNKAGQTAAVVNEAAEATVAVYQRTAGNTLTAKKVMVLNEITKEAEKFSTINVEEIKQEHGLACSEKIDIDGTSLFSGFSNSVGTTGVAPTARLINKAIYKVRLANVPGPIRVVLHPTHVFAVQDDIITQGATPFGNTILLDLLDAQPNLQNGFRGTIFGSGVWETQHVPSANSNADWLGAALNGTYALAYLDCGPAETIIEGNSSKRTREVSTDIFYDWKERLDGAGCGILGSQTAP